MNMLLLFVITMILTRPVLSVSSASVTLTVLVENFGSLTGNLCPTTQVQFMCMLEDVYTIRWFSNETQLSSYIWTPSDTYPIILKTPVGPVTIIHAAPDSTSADIIDGSSSLASTSTLLHAFNMQGITCGTIGIRSARVELNFNLLVPPPPDSSATCSFVISASGLDVSLQWSSSFNSQHAVERYRVSVDPAPSSSCSSDQVMPSEDYSCPGLSPQRSYTITVSAINCGDQEGESDTFTVLPHSGPRITSSGNVLPVFTPSGELDGITVLWEHINQSSESGYCSFNSEINYAVILEEHGAENVQKIINSNTCVSSGCSASFDVPSNDNYIVKITATDELGESPTIVIEVNNLMLINESNFVVDENTTATGSSRSQAITTTWTVAIGAVMFFVFSLILSMHRLT